MDRLIIGLTGTFGAGKSTVGEIFEQLGAARFDTDQIAHRALHPNSSVYEEIKNRFPMALDEQGSGFDRKKLAETVFNNPSEKEALEALIHPYVFEELDHKIQRTSKNIIVIEVPLLFESGYDRQCHKTVAVDASPEVIKKRLLKKGFSKEEIKQRQQAQLSASEKIKKANVIIHNDGEIQKTHQEVKKVWDQFCLEMQKGVK